MYLRGSRGHMQKQRKKRRSNPVFIGLLVMLILACLYFNQYVVPTIPFPQPPTLTPTRDPESYVNAGAAAFAEGNLLQAIDAYQQAILVDPDNPAIYIELARVQVLAGRYEAAQANKIGEQLRCRDKEVNGFLDRQRDRLLGDREGA